MANRHDDEYAAVAALRTTDGAPYRLTISTTAASITNLPLGRYIVILDGPGHALFRTGGTAAAPTSGNAAAGDTVAVQSGWTYTHTATATLSVITITGSGELVLQPVPPPG